MAVDVLGILGVEIFFISIFIYLKLDEILKELKEAKK